MKTPLFLLLSLFTSCGLLAQSTIGIYPSTAWASTQLLVNPKLDTGRLGQAIGYVSNGIVGPITVSGTGGGIPEAPLGTLLYARSNATWQPFPPGLATLQTDAPDNGLFYARRNNEWQNFIPGGGAGTNVGGTNRLKLAALSEFRPPATNGTLLPANTATFIRVNHIYDPDGLITQINTNDGSFRPAAGYYAITMVVPISVSEQGGGNVRIPFSIGLFDLTTTNDVYYQSYTVYDEDLSQYSQVFMPALITDGTHDFTIRVLNHSPTLDLVAGQAGNVAGLDNHYTEIQLLKLDGIAGLPEAPINSLLYARSNQNWISFTSPWAVQQLTKNAALESGTNGQAIGYTAPGVVGPITVSSGGGMDTNAVVSVSTIANLTNLVTSYRKALVGSHQDERWSFFQLVQLGSGEEFTYTNVFESNDDWVLGVPGCLVGIQVNMAPGSTNIIGRYFSPDCVAPMTYVAVSAESGRRYRAQGYVRKSNIPSATLVEGPNQDEWQLLEGSANVSDTFQFVQFEFTAKDELALQFAFTRTGSVGGFSDIVGGSWSFTELPAPGYEADGTNVFASAALPGYAWKYIGDTFKDAPADGQLFARSNNTWQAFSPGGGSAQSTNVVHAFVSTNELSTTTAPSGKAWVGDDLYSLTTEATNTVNLITDSNSWYDDDKASGYYLFQSSAVIRQGLKTNIFGSLIYSPYKTVVGNRYTLSFSARSYFELPLSNNTTWLAPGYQQTNVVISSTNVNSSVVPYTVEFTATGDAACSVGFMTGFGNGLGLYVSQPVLTVNGGTSWDRSGNTVLDSPTTSTRYVRQNRKWVPLNLSDKRVASATILKPSEVYATDSFVPLLAVDAAWAPNGIHITQAYYIGNTNGPYTLYFTQRTSPTSADDIWTTISNISGSETFQNASTDVPAGNIVLLQLPNTDMKWIQAGVVYFVYP